MGKEGIKDGVSGALQQFTNPATIASAAILQVLNSNYTKETVRRLIIDPVTRKFIPQEYLHGYDETLSAFWTVFKLFPEFYFKNFSHTTDEEAEKLLLEKAYEEQHFWTIEHYTCYEDGIYILSTKNGIIYMNITSPGKEAVGRMTLHFISLTNKLKDVWDKAYKEVSFNFSKEGISTKQARMVRVINFKNERPEYSTCVVPKTIIMDHVQNELDSIEMMIQKSDEISKGYELNKTIGVLLYGPHGTGKSTIARYLAMKLNRTLILTTATTLDSAMTYIKNDRGGMDTKYIILIEDIDFHFVDRRSEKKTAENAVTMAETELLFQILDGVLSNSNLMVIATTNYINRLDPALIRDGRFDFQIEVIGLSKEEAREVCERFDVSPDAINLDAWQAPISPASLQTYLLKYKTGSMKNLAIPDPVDTSDPEAKKQKKVSKQTQTKEIVEGIEITHF